jgi:hypothetical protein
VTLVVLPRVKINVFTAVKYSLVLPEAGGLLDAFSPCAVAAEIFGPNYSKEKAILSLMARAYYYLTRQC